VERGVAVAWEDHERFSLEVLRAERVPFGEPVPRRKQRCKRLALEERHELELFVVLRVVDNAEVEIPAPEACNLLGRVQVRDVRSSVPAEALERA